MLKTVSRCHVDVIPDWSLVVVASERGRRAGRRLQPASALCAVGEGVRHSRLLALAADSCRSIASDRHRRASRRARTCFRYPPMG
jgi:hypothetical protein